MDRFVRPKNLGLVVGPDGTIRLWEGRVRIPDLMFISWDRLPNRQVPEDPVLDLAPNLAIEILSPSNTPAEMKKKREDYFHVGVELAWEIDPVTRTAKVYTAGDEVTTHEENDTLDGGSVLPAFSLGLKNLFAELDRQG